VGERRGGLRDCDCSCDCDPVGELEAEAGGAALRNTYAKGSNGAASDGFIDNKG
jgi:hypothetical protein